jgi:uncharacterized protein (DUF58 family)
MKPGIAMFWGLLALSAVGTLLAFGVIPVNAFWMAFVAFFGVAVQDAFGLRFMPTPHVTREISAIITVGLEHSVLLRIRQPGAVSGKVKLDVFDLHPGDWPVFALPRSIRLSAGKQVELNYQITPTQRGAVVFSGCALRLHSGLRFWTQTRIAPCAQTVRVYPNFAPLAKLALVGMDQASRVVGAHLKRRRGEGTEFQQLREYRVGDSMRQIDWKASQRARKLISRDYQDERNQQIVLLLDTGRRMLAHDGVLTHFDHVLNASLMVAYMALRQGDAVGLMAHGGPARYIAPVRGASGIDPLLNGVFDLVPEPVATDYLAAASNLSVRQRRRALVLLITNARDEDIEDLTAAVRQLQKRHLVCVASLREAALDCALATPVNNLDQAVMAASMANYVALRGRAHQALKAQGVHVLDVNCSELPAALVEHYLAVKRSGLL